MNKFNPLFFSALVFLFSMLPCEAQNNDDYVIFSGQIENRVGETLTISGNGLLRIIPISPDGSFIDTIPDVTKGNYFFSHGEEGSALYLEPEFKLNLTLNPVEFDESIGYSGKGAEPNNYLTKKYLFEEKIMGDFENFFEKEEEEFKKELETLSTGFRKLLQESNNPFSDFTTTEELAIENYSLLLLTRYPMYHERTTHKMPKLSEGYFEPFSTIDLDDEEKYINSNDYRKIVTSYYTLRFHTQNDFSGITSEIKEMKSQLIKDEIAIELRHEINPANKYLDDYYKVIMEISELEEFREMIKKNYASSKKLSVGSPSPNFNYENHKGGKTSLKKLKGKYVYIDVWATWCGPCKAEIPHLKEIENEFHDKNIEFVSISLDKPQKHDAWKKMVIDLELGGIQLIADKDFSSDFMEQYVVNGIPRFILLDPKGKIVSADAPRPSTPLLKELLNSLL